MFEVKISKDIQCPLRQAFLFVGDFENDAKWWPGVLEARRLTAEKGVGARYWQKNRLLGIVYPITLEVDEYIDDTKISFRSEQGAIVFSGSYLFLENDNGITLTMIARVEANNFIFKSLSRLFRRSIEKMTEKNFTALKNVLEAQSNASIA